MILKQLFTAMNMKVRRTISIMMPSVTEHMNIFSCFKLCIKTQLNSFLVIGIALVTKIGKLVGNHPTSLIGDGFCTTKLCALMDNVRIGVVLEVTISTLAGRHCTEVRVPSKKARSNSREQSRGKTNSHLRCWIVEFLQSARRVFPKW